MRLAQMINAVDTHSGEPMRVITGGVLDVPGDTMLAKKQWLETEGDALRRRMLREPRGYPAVCCNLVLPATRPEAHAGFVVMEQTEYPAMSGGNTIAVATVLLETGMLPMREPVTDLVLESPAGLIPVRAECRGGKVTQVTFQNVPAFAVHLDAELDVPHLGKVRVDVAWGGMFYVLAEARQFDLEIVPQNGRRIAQVGAMLRAAAAEQLPVVHPEHPEFAGVSISQLWGPPAQPDNHGRNAVTVATGTLDWDRPETWTGALDRSACGTGTCARMAVLHARGELGLHQDFRHEGILGVVYTGRLIEDTRIGPYRAVVPTLSGQAWITGFASYVLDPTDPFPQGYTLGDLWA
jgi:proline racemase